MADFQSVETASTRANSLARRSGFDDITSRAATSGHDVVALEANVCVMEAQASQAPG
jgi:hypothetical protein